MKSFKLVALLLVLTLCFGCLFSCVNSDNTNVTDDTHKTPDDDTNKEVEENLQTETYKISVRVAFASDDDVMKAAIRNLNSATTSTVIEVDKNNLCITNTAEVGGYSVSKTYTLVDSTLYRHSVIRSSDMLASEHEWATITERDVDNLLTTKGEGAGIGIGDFMQVNMSKIKNGMYYECSEISNNAAKSLEEIFEQNFSTAEATIKLDSASYKLETYKGRNTSSTLTCNFVITMNDVDYTLTMRLYYTYDYDAQINISVPSDADIYTEVSYTEIVK